jgi:Fe-S-cluster containining protein
LSVDSPQHGDQVVNTWQVPVPGDAYPATRSQDLCLSCGACCAAFRVSFYWAESEEAAADSVPADMTCQLAPLLCAMKGTDQPHPRCIALQGIVGVSVWCAIYERRPSVCREVTPSGQNGTASFWCDRARIICGLPPLVPTTRH